MRWPNWVEHIEDALVGLTCLAIVEAFEDVLADWFLEDVPDLVANGGAAAPGSLLHFDEMELPECT